MYPPFIIFAQMLSLMLATLMASVIVFPLIGATVMIAVGITVGTTYAAISVAQHVYHGILNACSHKQTTHPPSVIAYTLPPFILDETTYIVPQAHPVTYCDNTIPVSVVSAILPIST
jgi:hypothetical protein